MNSIRMLLSSVKLRWICVQTCVLMISWVSLSSWASELPKALDRHRRDASTTSLWGDWGPWSECSRTCGGGIAEQTRPCLRRKVGSKFFNVGEHWNCVGLFQQYKSCNTEKCPDSSSDFRQLQCEEYNDKPFMGKLYQWEPFLKAPNPCALNCRAKGYRFYAKQADKVVDGTPCEPGSDDICVNGQCKQVGCDGILGSNTKLDRCGNCGGDSSQCKVMSGTFDAATMNVGYNMVVKIPQGATRINVTEMARSRNYLAVKGPNGKGYINSDWSINNPGKYMVAGTMFEYRRPLEPTSSVGELLLADGPTNEEVDIMLIYQQQNPGIHYEYIMPLDGSDSGTPDQQADSGDTQDVQGDSDPDQPQPGYQGRNPGANPGRDQSRITSANAGTSAGTSYYGRGQSYNGRYNPGRSYGNNGNPSYGYGGNTGSSYGSRYIPGSSSGRGVYTGPSYPGLQTPYGNSYNPRAQPGYQAGSNQGSGYNAGRNYGLQPPYGSGPAQPRPGYSRGGVYPGVSGSYPGSSNSQGSYPGGSNSRGNYNSQNPYNQGSYSQNGYQGGGVYPPNTYSGGSNSRNPFPGGSNPQGVNPGGIPQGRNPGVIPGRGGSGGRGVSPTDSQSPYQPATGLSRDESNPGFGGYSPKFYEWKEIGKTDCTVSCAGGTQQSIVKCVIENSVTAVSDSNCDDRYKPQSTMSQCNTDPCPARWETGAWSECSRTCGDGAQVRQVNCKQIVSQTLDILVAAIKCSNDDAPNSRRSCNQGNCPDWKVSEWSECSVRCGQGTRSRRVTCEDGNGVADDRLCSQLAKPSDNEGCDMGSCASKWYHSEWSDLCSEQCGTGVHTRRVVCSGMGENGAISESECYSSDKPSDSKSCNNGPCAAQWFAGSWSQCSAECGDGTQSRSIACISMNEDDMRVVSTDLCQEADAPATSQTCNLKPCEAEWFVTKWSECSKTCDGGHKAREVKCMDDDNNASSACDENKKPSERQNCNSVPCPTRAPNGNCKDKFSNCDIVVQANLCNYPYYKKSCCFSCFGR